MASYKTHYFCRHCSGLSPKERVWWRKEQIQTKPPTCPICGQFLRTEPRTNKGKRHYNFKGDVQIVVFAGTLK